MADNVWIIAEIKDGRFKKSTFELLSEGKKLAEKTGKGIDAIIIGKGMADAAAELGQYGASNVYVCEHDLLDDYSPEAYAKVVADLAKEHGPSILLGAATAMGRDFLPRLAARLGTGIASDCIELDIDDKGLLVATRPIYGGKLIIKVQIPEARPQMASLRPNVAEVSAPDAEKSAEVVNVAVSLGADDVKARIKEIVKGVSERVDLTEAGIIVAGGRAMKDADNFKILWELADGLGEGATVGASRAAVDSGYATHDMQVGQTGKVVNPNLYVACGISGAIQHLAGMRTSKVIVAVNKDPDAPIFQKADYGIVGDLFKVVPLLTEEIKKLKAQD